MENTSKQSEKPESSDPQSSDPLEVLRRHVVGVRDFGYWSMSPADVIELIDRAKRGTLGEFKYDF